MLAGIRAAALPGIDLAPARRWLTALAAEGGWDCDWYIPPAYGADEIGAAIGRRQRSGQSSTQLAGALGPVVKLPSAVRGFVAFCRPLPTPLGPPPRGTTPLFKNTPVFL
ncbi:hypothetical protein, partial [Streptomyces sp. NPDC058240]|uniref:hypothetical protein n=1 Tax=Streptomyces sp. NPDC058240 TaxID=3346396 RepID=UPI0036F12815